MTRPWMLIVVLSLVNPVWGQQIKSELQLTLPAAIYGVTGVPICIYFDNIVLTQSSKEYRFAVECKAGQVEGRRWTLTAEQMRHGTVLVVPRDAVQEALPAK